MKQEKLQKVERARFFGHTSGLGSSRRGIMINIYTDGKDFFVKSKGLQYDGSRLIRVKKYGDSYYSSYTY